MSGFGFNNNLGWRSHVCGLYYLHPSMHQHQPEKTYLPQVELQAHTTIFSTISRTTLTQTFVNPSETKGIKKVTYTFPLYDGVSVVGFTCKVDERTIIGEVKEKEKARTVFTAAVARGETAGLLEQLPDAADVFTTTVGNIPAGAKVVINITYLGELKHDMEVDGIRFTIPNIICPRYGNTPIGIFNNTSAHGTGISITVDAEMPDGSFIQQIRSPSHPIAINMGTTSLTPDSEPSMNKASATLSLGTTQLDTDFVLQVIAKDTGVPKAILEAHPTIPDQRALMATLVPRFSLPSEKPEVVFVCDRSGSMAGSRIKLVVQALKVFLKSLPIGVKFNICSFGSRYSFLWPKSVTYNQQHLDQAMNHAESFGGDYGGTEMLEPLKATIQQRYKDIPLEIVLLTDGEIWRPGTLFEYLNKEITDRKAPIRVFTLGIGNGVSHSLIEGIAKAGNGFSQAVAEGEKMDTRVVRMLKGALSPHVTNYTLEVKYTDGMIGTDEDDDFEIIEKVTDSLKIQHIDEVAERNVLKKPISLFDTSINLDQEELSIQDETGESRYFHLPRFAAPRVLQAPQNIPSLFAFNRTTVYLLLGPNAPQQTPKSIILRGTSVHGPLELEIPVQILETPGETIHQLAAKKAITELEQGRGWLREAKDESGKSVKEVFESRFEDMVEREAVRLGVQFQVGGKWCSFVAVEKVKSTAQEKATDAWLDEADSSIHAQGTTPIGSVPYDKVQALSMASASPKGNLQSSVSNPSSFRSRIRAPQCQAIDPMMAQQQQQQRQQQQQQPPTQHQTLGPRQMPPGMPPQFSFTQSQGNGPVQDYNTRLMLLEQQNKKRLVMGYQNSQLAPAIKEAAFATPTYPRPQPQGNHALQDYSMQLQLLEGQDRKRKLMAQRDQEEKDKNTAPSMTTSTPPLSVAAALMAPQEVDPALLEQYQMEMQSAAQMPLPDEDDEEDVKKFDNANNAGVPFGDIKDGQFDLDLGFADANTLQGFDFDAFLNVNHDTMNSNNFGFEPTNADTNSAPAKSAPPAGGLFGNSDSSNPASTSLFAPRTSQTSSVSNTFGSKPPATATLFGGKASTTYTNPFAAASPRAPSSPFAIPVTPQNPSPPKPASRAKTDDELLDAIIDLQTFEGSWEWSEQLFDIIRVSEAMVERELKSSGFWIGKRQLATALAVAFLERRLAKLKGSWELVVEKAVGWLGDGSEKILNLAVVVLEKS